MTTRAEAAPVAFDALAARLRRARKALLAVRTAYVLAVLVAVQWLALLAFALVVRHNGWLYYQGGDQLTHWTDGWLLAHWWLPPAFVGYAWPVLLMPLAPLGPNLIPALPLIVLFNVVVLLPVALLGLYGIGSRIAGRLFGYLVAAVWIAAPYVTILLVNEGYHQKYTEITLPQLLGLTAMSDFPSMVALIVSGYLSLRALATRGWLAAGSAGLAAGLAIGTKPANALFLVAPALALVVARWRSALAFAVGLAPTILTLALWKYRGLHQIPAFSSEPAQRIALGPGDLWHPFDRYTDLNSWTQLHNNLLGLREHFWASRVLEWLPVAGTVALLLRSRLAAVFVGSWFFVFFLMKGTYLGAAMDDASFFRLLMPAFPAYVVLTAAVALLVPGARARVAEPTPLRLRGRRLIALVSAVVAVFVIFPLTVVAATRPLRGTEQALAIQPTLLPVAGSIRLRATASAGEVRLEWRVEKPRGAGAFYRVLRTGEPGSGVGCAAKDGAPDDCRISARILGMTRAGEWADRPPAGAWTYRVGLAANWLDSPDYGDVYVLSRPVTIRIP